MHNLGVDIGGTFTDIISLDPDTNEFFIEKVSSTPDDPSRGFINGLNTVETDFSDIERLVHGTTVATNAVLEKDGPKCGLITTKGFQDILELGRRDRPNLWGLEGKYEPLIPRSRCIGVEERIDASGEVQTSLSSSEVKEAGWRLLNDGVESVIISFLHSYSNPANEKAAVDALHDIWPNEYVIRSSEVLPEFREFDRTSTTVVEGYTRPVISSYLGSLEDELEDHGYDNDLMIMQSNGGISTANVTRDRASRTLLSGPAGGTTAASYVAAQTGEKNIISCDMGGTSFDVCLLPGGDPVMTQDTELDYQVPIRVPMIDISAIGAGGGSIASVNEGGILQTGPESAGAAPGPVCYGQGGKDITITDANVVLQRINPDEPIGENLTLDAAHTEERLAADIADELGFSVLKAAQAVIDVGVDKMVGEIRELSVGQGYDPREFSLVVYGGAGPLHAGELINSSDVPRAIIPYFPGIFSALGCLFADSKHDNVMSVNEPLNEIDLSGLHEQITELEAQSRDLLTTESDVSEVSVIYKSDMKYAGQSHAITVPLPSGTPEKSEIREHFRSAYLDHYSQEIEAELIIDNLQVTVVGHRPSIDLGEFVASKDTSVKDAEQGERAVFFHDDWYDCTVYDRELLPTETEISGPAILEQSDTTTVVNPNIVCQIDEYGNVILEAEQ